MACRVYDTFVAKILYCGPKSPNSTPYLKVLLLGFLPASFFLDFNCYLITHLFLSSSEIQFYSGDNLGLDAGLEINYFTSILSLFWALVKILVQFFRP
jgi:hypothetical protein